jgi:hypothetical protein
VICARVTAHAQHVRRDGATRSRLGHSPSGQSAGCESACAKQASNSLLLRHACCLRNALARSYLSGLFSAHRSHHTRNHCAKAPVSPILLCTRELIVAQGQAFLVQTGHVEAQMYKESAAPFRRVLVRRARGLRMMRNRKMRGCSKTI